MNAPSLGGRWSAVAIAATLLTNIALADPSVAASTAAAGGQVKAGHIYLRPRPLDFAKRFPVDIVTYGKDTFQKKNIKWMALIVASTALLIVYDQVLVDKARNLGDHLGITHTQYQETVVSMPFGNGKRVDLLEGPFDSGSALYYIGDGWVDVGVAGTFLGYGLIKSDNRALQTSSELAESILASGSIVQVLKHITGRESPFTTNTPRGNWRFFPNQIAYAHDVPKHDAFPTGHLAAFTSMFTVLSENYNDYHFIRPLGYVLGTVLGFQMLNNGVHWASDYPLGIAIGYGCGAIAVRQGRRDLDTAHASTHFYPVVLEGGGGIRAVRRFGGGNEKEKSS